MPYNKLNTFLFFFLLLSTLYSQDIVQKGTITGRIIDKETKAPLIGANVVLVNTLLGAATNLSGEFTVNNVPIGAYSIQFSYIGYESFIKTDIIVRPERITRVETELKMSALETETISVSAGYFSDNNEQPLSVTSFSREEIRRSPGSAGDVSRILMSLPSIAKVNDQTNNLIVRGGSPFENAFYIDNIEIPNINHFPTQGASGGPIGLLNVDFIQDVNFYTGGFAATYGDKLSSIMNITFREGNREEFDGQLDLNFAGFGGVAEGPLFNRKGSWLLSIRRSYLDILVENIDIGTSVAPSYGDAQAKITYDINKNHKISLLSIWGDDHNNPDKDTAIENDMIYFGNQDIYESTTGINWRVLWQNSGYSNTSVAYTLTKFKEDFYITGSDIHLIKNRSFEQSLKLRNVNHFRLNKFNSLEFGIETKYLVNDYDNFYNKYTDALGDTVPAFGIDKNLKTNKYGVFVNFASQPMNRLSTTLGFRVDYFSYNKNLTLSPRIALSYQINDRASINASTGIFYQNLPILLLSQNNANKDLSDPKSAHYILGMDYLVTENTKFSVEIYQKDYQNFPLDPAQPSLFLIDELYYRYGFFFNHEQLINNGKAYSRGIELMLQKKLAKDFYGLASFSYFKTRYIGNEKEWRDRIYDNRIVFSIEGGYKPNNKWEFSLRWIYAGGPPYTPFNVEQSTNLNRAVLDENRINEARYPDYHSLNVRFDRRFFYSGSNLVFYLSIWNAYSRKNVACFYWNEVKNKQDTIYQWTLLPIFGLEFEF